MILNLYLQREVRLEQQTLIILHQVKTAAHTRRESLKLALEVPTLIKEWKKEHPNLI
jgi:hypothetical protein